MKELRFTTSNGDFLACDAINGANIHTGISLKDITEEQASEIVDEPFGLEVGDDEVIVFKDYEDEENTYSSSIDSLYSLIFSKGIYLYKNPFPKPENYDLWVKYGDFTQYGKTLTIDCLKWKEAEQKTFYNPYIFKITQ